MAALEHVNVAAIGDELITLYIHLRGPIRRVSETGGAGGIEPGLYWPDVRASLKRLKALLPDDPDLADCDIHVRSNLESLSRLVSELWEHHNFANMPVQALPGEPVFAASEWAHWDYEIPDRDKDCVKHYLGKFPRALRPRDVPQDDGCDHRDKSESSSVDELKYIHSLPVNQSSTWPTTSAAHSTDLHPVSDCDRQNDSRLLLMPEWYPDRNEVIYNGQVVRTVAKNASRIRPILDALQKANWSKIDCPFTDNPSARTDAISDFNRSSLLVKLRGDGTGIRIEWYLEPPVEPPELPVEHP